MSPPSTPAQVARLHADALTAVETTAAAWRDAQTDAERLRDLLDAAIAAAAEAGIASRTVAESAGFSPANITLIVAKATGRPLPPSIEARRAHTPVSEAADLGITNAGATDAGRETPNDKPGRDGTRWERWEDEAVADLYAAHGPNGGTAALRAALATRLERTPASILMRLGNFKSHIEGVGGLTGVARQTREVADEKGLTR